MVYYVSEKKHVWKRMDEFLDPWDGKSALWNDKAETTGKTFRVLLGFSLCVSVSVSLPLFLSVLLHLPASLPSPLESIRHQGKKNERNVNLLLNRREGTVRGVINIKSYAFHDNDVCFLSFRDCRLGDSAAKCSSAITTST